MAVIVRAQLPTKFLQVRSRKTLFEKINIGFKHFKIDFNFEVSGNSNGHLRQARRKEIQHFSTCFRFRCECRLESSRTSRSCLNSIDDNLPEEKNTSCSSIIVQA